MNIESLLPNLPLGKYFPVELCFLAQQAESTKNLNGDFLEVGSFAGRSSGVIGTIAKESEAHLFCVDIWDISPRAKKYSTWPRKISEIFQTNMDKLGLSETVIPIMDRSENVLKKWSTPLRFIHIDGCHEYEFVKKDIEWRNHLVKGGIICFHDYYKRWPGVVRAIDEAFNCDAKFSRIRTAYSVIAFRRDE